MRGVITLKDVIANFGLVVREFGAGCLWRCLWATALRKKTTFLDLAIKRGTP